MSNNLFSVRVYQINSRAPIPLTQVPTIGFPGGRILTGGVTGLTGISTGVSPYGVILFEGNLYYVLETQAQLITLANT